MLLKSCIFRKLKLIFVLSFQKRFIVEPFSFIYTLYRSNTRLSKCSCQLQVGWMYVCIVDFRKHTHMHSRVHTPEHTHTHTHTYINVHLHPHTYTHTHTHTHTQRVFRIPYSASDSGRWTVLDREADPDTDVSAVPRWASRSVCQRPLCYG